MARGSYRHCRAVRMTKANLPSVPNLVARFRRNIRRSIEIADQIAGVRVGGPSRQELVRRFDGTDFLGDGGGDPLIERNAVVPGQTRGGLLQRGRQMQRVPGARGSTHCWRL